MKVTHVSLTYFPENHVQRPGDELSDLVYESVEAWPYNPSQEELDQAAVEFRNKRGLAPDSELGVVVIGPKGLDQFQSVVDDMKVFLDIKRIQADDWEGFYFDDELRIQGHSVDANQLMESLVGFYVQKIQSFEIEQAYMEDIGSLPKQFSELPVEKLTPGN